MKKVVLVTFATIIIIIVSALIKGFNFETNKFENINLAIVYISTIIIAISIIVRTFREKKKKP